MKYPVKARTILLCDYGMGGFRPPEMVKRRPVIVLIGSLPGRPNLHTVVPMSGTPSKPDCWYQCRLALPHPLPAPFSETEWWVKCDMVATVSIARLELFRTPRDQYGKRKYLNGSKVDGGQFELVKHTVRAALGLNN